RDRSRGPAVARGLRSGRPRLGTAVTRPAVSRYALAVDVGGTKLEAALVSDDGVLVVGSRSRRETGRSATSGDLNDALVEVIAHALSRLPDEGDLVGAGIGSAGPVDRDSGRIFPVNMPLARGYELADAVMRAASGIL